MRGRGEGGAGKGTGQFLLKTTLSGPDRVFLLRKTLSGPDRVFEANSKPQTQPGGVGGCGEGERGGQGRGRASFCSKQPYLGQIGCFCSEKPYQGQIGFLKPIPSPKPNQEGWGGAGKGRGGGREGDGPVFAQNNPIWAR